MRKPFRPGAIVCLLAVCVTACIEPYSPPQVPATGDLIVIEGNVNTTDHIATVRLTHPVVLNSDDTLQPETGATVTITTEAGKIYHLSETQPGIYSDPNIDIQNGARCSLSVQTSSGGQYDSDLVEIRRTPPIDSVYVNYLDDETEIMIDSHDDTGKTTYYQWTYVETWEYTAEFESRMTRIDGGPRHRRANEGIYRCYKTVPSSKIIVLSTNHLNADVVRAKVLLSIPVPSQKTAIRYSILVTQRAITEAEYIYQSQLQKSTEGVGGLFDAQPSQVYGNVRRVSEKGGTALGYFGGGSYDQQRIFHDFYDFPPHLLVPLPRYTCQLDTVCINPPTQSSLKCSIDLQNLASTTLIVDALTMRLPGFTATSDECADCRKQGGVLEHPDFW